MILGYFFSICADNGDADTAVFRSRGCRQEHVDGAPAVSARLCWQESYAQV